MIEQNIKSKISKSSNSNQIDSKSMNINKRISGTQSHKTKGPQNSVKILHIVHDKNLETSNNTKQIPNLKSEPSFKKKQIYEFKNLNNLKNEFNNNLEVNYSINSNLNDKNINISNQNGGNINYDNNSSTFKKYDINYEIEPKKSFVKLDTNIEINENQKLPVMLDVEMKDSSIDNNNIKFNNLVQNDNKEINIVNDIEMTDETSNNFNKEKKNSYHNLIKKVSQGIRVESPITKLKMIKLDEEYDILIKKIANDLKIKTRPASYKLFKKAQYNVLVRKIADGLRYSLNNSKINHFYYKTLVRKIAMKLKENLSQKKVNNLYYKTLIRKIAMKLKEKLSPEKHKNLYYKTLIRKIALTMRISIKNNEKMKKKKQSNLHNERYTLLIKRIASAMKPPNLNIDFDKIYYKMLVRKIANQLKIMRKEPKHSFYHKACYNLLVRKIANGLKRKVRQPQNKIFKVETNYNVTNDIEMKDDTQNNINYTDNTNLNIIDTKFITNDRISFSNPNDVKINNNYSPSKRISIENSSLNDTTFDINVNAKNIEKIKELKQISEKKPITNSNTKYDIEMKEEIIQKPISTRNDVTTMNNTTINDVTTIRNQINVPIIPNSNIVTTEYSVSKKLNNISNQNSQSKTFISNSKKNSINNNLENNISSSIIPNQKLQVSSFKSNNNYKILTPSKNQMTNQLTNNYLTTLNISKSKTVTPLKAVYSSANKSSNKNKLKDYFNSLQKKEKKIIREIEEEKNNNDNYLDKINSKSRIAIQLKNINSSSQNFIQDFEQFLNDREIEIIDYIPYEIGLKSLGILSNIDFCFLLMDYLVKLYKIDISKYIKVYKEFSKYSRTKEELENYKKFFITNLLRNYTSEEIKSELNKSNIHFNVLNDEAILKLIPEPKLNMDFNLVESKRIKTEEMEKNENYHKHLSKCIHKIILKNKYILKKTNEINLEYDANIKNNENDIKIDSSNSFLISGNEIIKVEKKEIATSPFKSKVKEKSYKENGNTGMKIEKESKSTSPIKMVDEEIDVNMDYVNQSSNSSNNEKELDTPKFSSKKNKYKTIEDDDKLNNIDKEEERKNFLNELTEKIKEEENEINKIDTKKNNETNENNNYESSENENINDEKEVKKNKKKNKKPKKKEIEEDKSESNENEEEKKKKKNKKMNRSPTPNKKKKKTNKNYEIEEDEEKEEKDEKEEKEEKDDSKSSENTISDNEDDKNKKNTRKKSPNRTIKYKKIEDDEEENNESEGNDKKITKGGKSQNKKKIQSKKRRK